VGSSNLSIGVRAANGIGVRAANETTFAWIGARLVVRRYLRDASPAAVLGDRRALLVEGGDQSILPLTLSGRVHRRDIDLLDHAD